MLETLRDMQVDVAALRKKALLPEDLEVMADRSYVLLDRLEELFNILEEELGQADFITFCTLAAQRNADQLLETMDFSHCSNLRDALMTLSANSQTLNLRLKYELIQHLGSPWFGRRRPVIDETWFRYSELYILVAFTCLIRRFTGITDWSTREVFIVGDDVTLFRDFLPSVQYYTGREFTALALSDDLLEMPLTPATQSPKSVEMPAIEKTMSGTLRLSLPMYLSEGRPSIEKVAQLSGINSRTLKRRLKEENTSYSEILDQCIMEMAKEMLIYTRHSIADIALSVGYPYTNHFCRAFKRLTGETPSHYRAIRQYRD